MQTLNSAKKSKSGRVARRAMDMLIKQTAVAPVYRQVVSATRSPKRRKPRGKESLSISMCVGKMVYAACDPFSQTAQGACIPDGSAVSSVRGFVRRQIVMSIGTGSVGFCHFYPTLASDCIAFAVTNSAFTGSTTQFLSANSVKLPGIDFVFLPTNTTANQLSKGWGGSDDRAQFSSRIVGAGFSYRYTGKEIDRAGQAYTYIHPQHNSSASYLDEAGVDQPFSAANLASFLETHIVECAREDTHVPMVPTSMDELEYSGEQKVNRTDLIYPWSQGAIYQPGGFIQTTGTAPANTIDLGIPIATLMVIGTPGSSYAINYGQHYETIGLGVAAYSKLPAESDPVGVQDVMSAFSRFSLNRKREPGVNPVAEFKSALRSVQSDRGRRMGL